MSTPKHPQLYQFLDYQEFLREVYAAEKSVDEFFSYRVFAAAVDIDASLLVKILQGKRHLSPDGVDRMVKFLRLDAKREEYFRELVTYGKATRDDDLRRSFESLQRLRPAACRRLEEDRYRYFQHWHYPAIRSALDVHVYRSEEDAAGLGKCFKPSLSVAQVVEAVGVLQRLGLIEVGAGKRLVPATAHLSTGERWQSAAVREYQRQLIGLAAESIEGIPKEQRDVSSLTLALDSSQIERLRAVLAEARRSIVRQVDAMPPSECNAVYQLNIQLFPVMRLEEPK